MSFDGIFLFSQVRSPSLIGCLAFVLFVSLAIILSHHVHSAPRSWVRWIRFGNGPSAQEVIEFSHAVMGKGKASAILVQLDRANTMGFVSFRFSFLVGPMPIPESQYRQTTSPAIDPHTTRLT